MQVYIFCILWSIGAALLGPSRVKFDLFIRKVHMHQHTQAEDTERCGRTPIIESTFSMQLYLF